MIACTGAWTGSMFLKRTFAASIGTPRYRTNLALRGAAVFAAPVSGSSTCSLTGSTQKVQNFINEVNVGYEEVHRKFEEQFWGTKMALSNGTLLSSGTAPPNYSVAALTETKKNMEDFLADPKKLEQTRELLKEKDISPEQKKVLSIFERTFKCYIMENPEAKQLREEATKLEGILESERNRMKLGATIGGEFKELSSVGLRNRMRTDDDETIRRACWEGLRSVGPFVCTHGFIDIVVARNRMAKALGYEDFYDYKVTQAEGFGKARLFAILGTLEQGTRSINAKAREQLAASKGAAALEAWNTGYMTAGDVTQKMDPYFPFERSVEAWGRSFAAMGIRYKGATMDLDLLDRKGKYSNGFCHWPQPAWVHPDGRWQPSVTHFTSLADPKAVGSGLNALNTLMHEAGHAAHFANVVQPSPLFAQERAPTSVAYAELQSMLLDSLVGDAAWRGLYARDRSGQVMPWDLVKADIEATHPYKVFTLRAMLAVPYFEKALYELPEAEVTAERIQALADEVEARICGGLGGRPLLSVPHLLADEASCYYHGYVLAEMAVHQTREHLLKTLGRIVDNPAVGPALTEAYWKWGNSEIFLDLVHKFTGTPLTGDAWVRTLGVDLAAHIAQEKEDYDKAVALPAPSSRPGDVDLDMRVRFVDGDAVIGDTAATG
eukprot:CAMPEP_0113690894 /NCGR_PEP_ID=MMETSP0038_2-20120614/18078_1 /TAXON_ID=2898 /ORGANISM="Cryptomonas paramecium" /LENGTH=663 /DNA_ID=CAMNT_0000612337 /DNA_START=93 /DNA_END=2080 /DNA_ORIENTATION=- /assembly_acc=CAM_ASM_000170